MREKPYSAGTYVVPEEHQQFFAAFEALILSYPEAGKRFGLHDLGQSIERRPIIWESECFDMGGFRVCEDKPRPE